MIGTVAIRVIDIDKKIVELKRMFVLPEHQSSGFRETEKYNDNAHAELYFELDLQLKLNCEAYNPPLAKLRETRDLNLKK